MNSDMLNELFDRTECGFRNTFIKRLEEWKSSHTVPLRPHISLPFALEPTPACSNDSTPNTNVSYSCNESESHERVFEIGRNVNLEDLDILTEIRMLLWLIFSSDSGS